MTINHGIPQSPYFLIAQPYNGKPMGDLVRRGTEDDPYRRVTLKDPKSGNAAEVEIHDMWRFSYEDRRLLTAWAKLAYGITGPQLLKALKLRHPSFNFEVEFLLLKKVSE